MPKFIYVYGKDARDKLASLHYQLLKSDEGNDIYVFAQEDRVDFEKMDLRYTLSDMLTF